LKEVCENDSGAGLNEGSGGSTGTTGMAEGGGGVADGTGTLLSIEDAWDGASCRSVRRRESMSCRPSCTWMLIQVTVAKDVNAPVRLPSAPVEPVRCGSVTLSARMLDVVGRDTLTQSASSPGE